MFRGVSSILIDGKGRIAIPTRYRAELEESCDRQLILTIDRDPCLLLYPLGEWETIEHKLMKLPSLNPQAKRLQRLLIGHATECQMDTQGRVLVAEPLRRYADLKKSVALIGQGNKFEIWDEDNWAASRRVWLETYRVDDLSELAPELSSLSL